jgi:hypothetical protein
MDMLDTPERLLSGAQITVTDFPEAEPECQLGLPFQPFAGLKADPDACE